MAGVTATYVFLAVLVGLVPAAVAHRKGRNFVGWWLFGAALWIVAMPASLVIHDDRYAACRFCREPVRRDALVCPHCQRDLGGE